MVRRDIEKDVVPYSIEHNISIFAYSPLQRGLLAGRIKPDHKFNDGDTRPSSPYYKEPNFSNILGLLENLRPMADAHDATLSQLILNWTIHQPGITCALAGARNPLQVIENIGASKFRLTGEEIKKINKYISGISIDTNI
jgi:aryl-alcohol dehydrogenase-like predicted oxidoreductase